MIVKHPLLNQTFELRPDGLVDVVDLDTGRSGVFERHGRAVSGALTFADPQLLDWVGGKPQEHLQQPREPVHPHG